MSWLESDQRYISAQGQPTAVLDLCLQRGIDSHRLLRGTGLFTEDILKDETLISPQQYIRLLDNAEQLLASEDTAFQLGQRLLPGSQGAASQLLTLTQNLQQALQLLVTYKVLMSPVISPRFFIDQNFGYL